MEDTKIQKPRIETLFRGTNIAKLLSNLRLEFNIGFIHQGVSFCNAKRDNSKCKCNQGKAILFVIEFYL